MTHGSEPGDPGGEQNQQDLDYLFTATYDELRRLASTIKRRDQSATLNPTALVNEAWLKLASSQKFSMTSRLHFKRIAARAMRQVLVDAARRRQASKRGGDDTVVTFGDAQPVIPYDRDLVGLADTLDELARLQPRQAMMVESRFFGGLEVAEIAELLKVSEVTILRDWRAARAWLQHQLRVQGTLRLKRSGSAGNAEDGGLRRGLLAFVLVGCLSRLLQLVVDLVQQILGFLGVALQVPLIGLLGGDDFRVSLGAQSLGGREVRMASGRDVIFGALGNGDASDGEQGCNCNGDNPEFDHAEV